MAPNPKLNECPSKTNDINAGGPPARGARSDRNLRNGLGAFLRQEDVRKDEKDEEQASQTGHPSSGGEEHLAWIERFQYLQIALGTFLWLFHSWRASVVFALAGIASVTFWHAHRFLISRMLTPKVRKRFLYGFLILFKLALIALVLRAMMSFFPEERIALTTGILVFVWGILMEAIRLLVWSPPQEGLNKG